MPPIERKKLGLAELLNSANKRYNENYLSAYFDVMTGDQKEGSGDTLAEFIVLEIRETFDERRSRKRQIALAVRALERAKQDIQSAIDGLCEM